MTSVDPFASVRVGSSPTTTASGSTATASSSSTDGDNNQVNEDTFLQLLVAQLKYQDPLDPTNSTDFLTQTAQFTMVEKLQEIEADQKATQLSNQTLTASTMVGRSVTYQVQGDNAPVATQNVTLGGNLPSDAAVGARFETSTDIYNAAGSRVPLTLDFTRTSTGYDVQASSNGTPIGSPSAITFNDSGERTSGDLSLSASNLNALDGTSGTWPDAGITLHFGDASDSHRVESDPGTSTISVRAQDGSNGQTKTGIVTGIAIDSTGAHVLVNGDSVDVSAVTQVEDAS